MFVEEVIKQLRRDKWQQGKSEGKAQPGGGGACHQSTC